MENIGISINFVTITKVLNKMRQRKDYSESEIMEMIHERGLRPSMQRIAVLAEVANSASHPSAEAIYSGLSPKYPSLSKTTVYNSLHALCEAGLVKELDIESETRHYDLALQPRHSHFVCRECGRIADMKMPAGVDDNGAEGFLIDSVEVCYRGLCPDCIAKNNNPKL